MVDFDYINITEDIDLEAIRDYIANLSNFETRATGYVGCEKAADYIFQKFNEFGLSDIHFEYYNVTVPVDLGANITVLIPENHFFRAYPLFPNDVQSCSIPPGGITGKLVYGGIGTLSALNYKEINGSIVLMEFNSGRNWINAAMLGAKAVIFLPPAENFDRSQGLAKSTEMPLYLPRLLVSKEDSRYLYNLTQQGEVIVNVQSQMAYEIREAKNVVGFIRGKSRPEEIIVISAHYDSWSVIPSLAPGADDAIGIATLIDLARLFSLRTPSRTIMFVAFSGHWQSLAGAREFVSSHFTDPNIKIMFNLDLSGDVSSLCALFTGYFYMNDKPVERFGWVSDKMFREYLPSINAQLNQTLNVRNLLGPEWIEEVYLSRDFKVTYDSEPYTLAGGLGVTFASTGTIFPYRLTPSDTIDKINFQNLWSQLNFIYCVLYSFANDSEPIQPSVQLVKYSTTFGGFSTLEGRIVEFDYRTGWYSPVPGSIAKVNMRISREYFQEVSNYFIVKVDENGTFILQGVTPSIVIGANPTEITFSIDAYLINQTTGSIEYATDFGQYGAKTFQIHNIMIDRAYRIVTIPMFRCGTIVFYNVVNPATMRQVPMEVTINDFLSHTQSIAWGYKMSERQTELMAFVPPNTPVEILLSEVILGVPVAIPTAIFINSSFEHPEGAGFHAGGPKQASKVFIEEIKTRKSPEKSF